MAQRPRRGKPTRRRRRPGTTVRRRRRRYRLIEVDSASRGPQVLWLIILGLALAGATIYYFGPGTGDDEAVVDDFAPADASGSPSFAALDPAPFRAEIDELETALFETPGASDGRFELAGQEIAGAITPLLGRLRSAEGERAPAAVSDLESLAEAASEDGFDLDRLRSLRDRWLQIRRATFDSADWLRGLPSSDASSGPDLAVNAVYRDIADELLGLVDSALSEAESLVEGEEYMDPTELAGARAQWSDSVESWRDELGRLRSRLPDRPSTSGGPELLSAVQRLESALDSAKGLFTSSAPPRSPLNRRPYQQALESIQRSIEAFDRLEG